jgi:hypothetical protein
MRSWTHRDDMDFEPMKEEESPLTDSVELSKQEELAK